MADPIHEVVEKWHQFMRGEVPGGLDDLLAEDIVFFSPVVFTPQVGKEIAKVYLTAAGKTLGESKDSSAREEPLEGDEPFHYTKEILSGYQAALEFELVRQGKYMNGVDIITCNDKRKITEFRVLIRPLQAVNQIHQMMGAMLKKMGKA